MDASIIAMILIGAVLGQAIIEAVKPLWQEDKRSISYSSVISLVIGLVIAFAAKLDVAKAIGLDMPKLLSYAITGILIARGSNFVNDLFKKINPN